MKFTQCRNLAVSLLLSVVVLALRFRESEAGQAIQSRSFEFEPRRRLLQTANVSDSNSHVDNTVRIDPFDHFKKYRGGFNITNKHYWSSTVFTGVYGYAIGAVWLLAGIAYGGFLLIFYCIWRKTFFRRLQKRPPCDRQCALWPVLLAICFIVLAITASGVVLGGSARFHSRTRTVLDIIMDTADHASETIYRTTGSLKEIRDNLQASDQGGRESNFLNSTSHELDSQAATIGREARKNRRRIHTGLKIVYIVTTVSISLNLVALVALSGFGFLRFRSTLKWVLVLCWLLTALCWFIFGAYFFLERFAGDTCTALNNFQENPYNNTLSSILPCDELLSAKPVLADLSAGIYNLVNEINANISQLQAPSPSIVQVCNPFSGPPEYAYQLGVCPENTVRIRDIPQVLKMFTCSDSNNEACRSGEFVSASDVRRVEAYTSSLQDLLNNYPEMERLLECGQVKDAFSEILQKHCRPLERYVRMVWIPMICLSSAMVILVLIWVVKSHHEQKHHGLNRSVRPESRIEHT